MPLGKAILIPVLAVALTLSLVYYPSIVLGLLSGVAVLAVAIGSGWVFYHPEYVPELLVAVAYLSLLGFNLSIGGLHLRPNMLIALVGLVWGLREKSPVPVLPLFVVLNVSYLASTLLHPNSPVFFRGLADCFLLSVNLLQYSLTTKFRRLDQFLRVLFCASSAAFTILAGLYLALAAGLLPELEKSEGSFVRLSLLDPTTASYILFTLVALIFYLYLFGYPYSKTFTLWCLIAHFAALAFSFARASWLAFLITFLAFWLFCLVRFPLGKAVRGTVIVVMSLIPLGVIGLWYASSETGSLLAERAQRMSLEEGTVLNRLILWYNMLEDWRSAPILGYGAHAYAKFQNDPTQVSENYTLELLHSGGVITAGLFLLCLGLLVFRAVPRRWQDATNRPWALPLAAGFVAMSVSALANPAMTGGIYWIAAGLVAVLGSRKGADQSTKFACNPASPISGSFLSFRHPGFSKP
jgi:prepilin signal peptidase PulO-like enzyme (type II secretory pathway)